MDPSDLPFTPRHWKHTFKSDNEPVLNLSIRRPAFPDAGKTARMERYFAQVAQQWKTRWENVLFPRACQALADARETGILFLPWQASLDYTVTLWRAPLLSLRLDCVESCPPARPLFSCAGETWDCASGYPRPLRSFFPPRAFRWRKELLKQLREQAAQQLASGESLLDADCAQHMERTFDPDRFYLTEEGLSVYYPLCQLGAYAEGIPVFTATLPGWQSALTRTDSPLCPAKPGGGTPSDPAQIADIPAPEP